MLSYFDQWNYVPCVEIVPGFHLVLIMFSPLQDFQIEASFTDNSHSGCVKCVSVSEKGILASGSTDETIRLLNLRKKKEMGSLVHHNGKISGITKENLDC